MKTLIVAVAAYNLAETSRMIEIAKKAKAYFDITFMTYGGKFENLIDEQGFERIHMEPQLTSKKLVALKKVLNGDGLNSVDYFNKKEIDLRVKAEMDFFRIIKPAAVISGWNLTVGISARVMKVPFVNVLHSTSITEYYESGLQSIPDNIDLKFLEKLISKEKRTAMFNKRVLEAKLPVKPYNSVAKKYGIGPFKNFVDFIEGDLVFLADIPAWVDHKELRDHVYHIGPLPAHLDIDIPESVMNISKEQPVVFFAMGSSGKGTLIKDIIEGFKGKPYTVIAPIATHIKELDIEVPANVIVTDFIPADKVNPMADVAIIHGGQNTVMNACISGTPFVGIGMHAEQQANIDACVRKGFAIRLSKKYVTCHEILDNIDQLLSNKEAKESIDRFGAQLLQWNGPEKASLLLNEFYG